MMEKDLGEQLELGWVGQEICSYICRGNVTSMNNWRYNILIAYIIKYGTRGWSQMFIHAPSAPVKTPSTNGIY